VLKISLYILAEVDHCGSG